jgi:hypothetical protein
VHLHVSAVMASPLSTARVRLAPRLRAGCRLKAVTPPGVAAVVAWARTPFLVICTLVLILPSGAWIECSARISLCQK